MAVFMPTSVYTSYAIETYDLILQKSGPSNYFVQSCKDNTYKRNQFIGEEGLLIMKMAGLKVRVVDWQGKTLDVLDFKNDM